MYKVRLMDDYAINLSDRQKLRGFRVTKWHYEIFAHFHKFWWIISPRSQTHLVNYAIKIARQDQRFTSHSNILGIQGDFPFILCSRQVSNPSSYNVEALLLERYSAIQSRCWKQFAIFLRVFLAICIEKKRIEFNVRKFWKEKKR